jgi:hypothetical protein
MFGFFEGCCAAGPTAPATARVSTSSIHRIDVIASSPLTAQRPASGASGSGSQRPPSAASRCYAAAAVDSTQPGNTKTAAVEMALECPRQGPRPFNAKPHVIAFDG